MTETEKPRRKPGLTCPLRGGKDVSKVCHTCELYVNLKGKDPHSEGTLDNWGCAWSFVPVLLVENTQMEIQTGAAVESMRNEAAKAARRQNNALAGLAALLTSGDARPGIMNGGPLIAIAGSDDDDR
jgi:hypothetical protein